MPKKKILVISVIVTALLTLLAGAWFYCEKRLEMRETYIAGYDLSNRVCISENEIKKVRVPSAYLDENVINDKEEILGKYVKINSFIPKGSFFYKTAIETPENMKDNIDSQLSEGEVSYDIYLSDIKVNQAYLVKGMYVDVYLTINKERVLSDLLINNLKIIGLYDVYHNEIRDYDHDVILESITLAVPKESVAYLNKATVVGELNITVGENTYEDVGSVLNKEAAIFRYLDQ